MSALQLYMNASSDPLSYPAIYSDEEWQVHCPGGSDNSNNQEESRPSSVYVESVRVSER